MKSSSRKSIEMAPECFYGLLKKKKKKQAEARSQQKNIKKNWSMANFPAYRAGNL